MTRITAEEARAISSINGDEKVSEVLDICSQKIRVAAAQGQKTVTFSLNGSKFSKDIMNMAFDTLIQDGFTSSYSYYTDIRDGDYYTFIISW